MKFELGEERAVETYTAMHWTPVTNEDDDGTNPKRNRKQFTAEHSWLQACWRHCKLRHPASRVSCKPNRYCRRFKPQTLSGHFPKAARQLAPRAPLPTDSQLSLVLGLPLNDAAGLEEFLQRVYDPSDPLYRHFLSPEEFTKRFGPTPAQYDQMVSFAARNHLKVVSRHSNRMLLDVRGSVADVQHAFQVTLHTYKHPRENRDFYAPASSRPRFYRLMEVQ